MSEPAILRNGGMVPISVIPRLSHIEFGGLIKARLTAGRRLASCFAVPVGEGEGLSLFAVLTEDSSATLEAIATVPLREFDSLTPEIPQLHLFEREIGEQYGVTFAGHPWFKPVRFHAPWPGERDAWGRDPRAHPKVGEMNYFTVEGEEIHEVGVGPVHAGVIEPGHFRFQCYGERVLHLEISLGYQHRGIEKMLTGGPWPQTPMQIETMAGDTS
ncbi:MAG TPA: NADH-quinone oxidoreductase subunit C, partial [Pseudodesulfovibrio sp.]|nr:NADH-quinone oxidoreductase subunit C [Pseudodesulfovibrio sp.]